MNFDKILQTFLYTDKSALSCYLCNLCVNKCEVKYKHVNTVLCKISFQVTYIEDSINVVAEDTFSVDIQQGVYQ